MKRKFYISTLGCKVNQYDSLVLRRELIGVGFEYAKENPDLLIVSSCAVTKQAMTKSKKLLNKLRKENPKAKVALVGCWPKIEKSKFLKKLTGADFVCGRGREDLLLAWAQNAFVLAEEKGSGEFSIDPPRKGERSRYTIKIQDGCNQFCSYCIIPHTRGVLKSVPEERILAEIEVATKNGYREVVLCGIHLGRFGQEKMGAKGDELATLLKKILLIKKLGRVRLSSIEMNEVSDELIRLVGGSKKICNHFHLPLQAGTNKILKLMRRPYTTEEFEKKITKIRKAIPDVAITTDVIVGFPGETESDFLQCVKFCTRMKFSKIHVFPFSAHQKTPAAKMEGQISLKTKKGRSKILRSLSKSLEEKYKKKFQNKKVAFVIQSLKKGFISGKEEHYFDVKMKKSVGTRKVGELFKGVLSLEE